MDGTDDNADWAEVRHRYFHHHHHPVLKAPFTLTALIVIITVTIIVSIAMLQVLQAMDAMGFDGNEQGEIISAVRLSISHGDDDYEEIL